MAARDTMTGAEIAATRHLLGLSQAELAQALDVNRNTVKDWERGAFNARPGVVADLLDLRAHHDIATADAIAAARDGVPLELPQGPRPRGWYLAQAARVLDVVPDADVDWAD